MKKQSAGLLLFRHKGKNTEVLLVHPGGPFWAKKNGGAWSIPKGEFAEGEEPLAAAKRECTEELGAPVPDGELIELGSAKQAGGKLVHAWAVQADFDVSKLKSNTFTMEWPPKSGMSREFPEVDKAAWFSLDRAQTKIVKGQVPLLEALARHLNQAMPKSATDEQTKAPQQTQLL